MINLISKKSALLTLEWCIHKYGPSRFAKLSTLKIKLNSRFYAFGEYDQVSNVITLNPKKHNNLKEWVSTVIHEYTHFRQPIGEKYDQYFEQYGRNYDNHPYEITACNKSDRDSDEARRWVLKRINELRDKLSDFIEEEPVPKKRRGRSKTFDFSSLPSNDEKLYGQKIRTRIKNDDYFKIGRAHV